MNKFQLLVDMGWLRCPDFDSSDVHYYEEMNSDTIACGSCGCKDNIREYDLHP